MSAAPQEISVVLADWQGGTGSVAREKRFTRVLPFQSEVLRERTNASGPAPGRGIAEKWAVRMVPEPRQRRSNLLTR